MGTTTPGSSSGGGGTGGPVDGTTEDSGVGSSETGETTGGVVSERGAWGNPQIAWSLGDTQWGGDSGLLVSHRVRFPRSGAIVAVRLYTIYVEGDPGGEALYHKGDGGTFRAMLQTDDASEAHVPSGNVLGQTDHIIGAPPMYGGSGPKDAIVGGDPGDSPFFRKFYFQRPIAVEADTWYHLVVENTTLDPTAHFVSRDDYVGGGDDRDLKVPTRDPLQDAILYRGTNDTEWTTQTENWAIGVFQYDDGTAYGNGYMEVGSVSGPDRVARYVDDARSVRQVFTVPEAIEVDTIALGAMHVSGDNVLDLRLVADDDTELWQGTVSDFPTDTPSGDPVGDASPAIAEFREASVDPPVPLAAGQTYRLEVSSQGGEHTVVATRDGSLSYDFSTDSTVIGRAELRETPMAAWEGWPLRDTPVDDQFDLSFYLGFEHTPR
ncbi:MAG: hypothetical protein AAF721_28365 [Myxococcota bacterium]